MRLLNIIGLSALLILPLYVFGQNATQSPQPKETLPPEPTAISPTTPTPVTGTPPVIIKMFEGQLDNVNDRTPIEQDAPYNVLLKYISRLNPDKISAKIRPEITFENLMKTPEKYRGELIYCKGVLLFLNPYTLRTNTAGVDVYYSGMIGNPSTDEFYFFHLIDKPNEPLKNLAEDRSLADEVEVEGAFLKIALYELDARAKGRSGKTHNSAPFIIGRKITKVVHPPPEAARKFQWLIAVVLGAILMFIFFYVVRTGRKERKETMSLFSKHKDAPPPKRNNS
ncbi:MAG: hypothetical protein HZA49_08980 [Planctomycetes bacterium]|nr:hypothetical protein [Planctomycetota bacterium]